MKNIFYLLVLLAFASCSENVTSTEKELSNEKVAASNENTATLENVIQEFCAASSQKNEKKMTNLVYPGLFNQQLDKQAVQYMFRRQLMATERFLVTNIQEAEKPKLVYEFKNDEFYIQTYTSDIDIKISPSSTVAFQDLVTQITQNDPNAEVNELDQSIKFSEKRKILIVKNAEGTYVLPEVFLDFLSIEGLDVQELKQGI
jgi:molybdopterin-biosynthesis enzyme MoeA-like protein